MKPDDPVSRGAERAIAHLNDDHADALLEMAQALGGHPEATAARCVDADRTGLDLLVVTPRGETEVRVPYEEPIEEPARACARRRSGSPRRRGPSWAWTSGRSRPSSYPFSRPALKPLRYSARTSSVSDPSAGT